MKKSITALLIFAFVILVVIALWGASIFQVYQGGTGNNTLTAHAILLGEGASPISSILLGTHQVAVGQSSADPVAKTVPDCQDVGGNHLNYTQSTDVFSCGTTSSGGGGGGGNVIWPTFVQPSTANFTWFDQGTSTATNKSNRIAIDIPDGGGTSDHLRGLYSNTALPSPPYTVEVGVVISGQNDPSVGALLAYAGVYDTSSTKAAGATIKLQGGTAGIRADHWNSPTSFGAVVGFSGQIVARGSLCFARVTDDGTTRKYWWSNDGLDYNLITSEATNTFVTPTNGFFGFYNENGQSVDAIFSVFHFQVSNSILSQFAP